MQNRSYTEGNLFSPQTENLGLKYTQLRQKGLSVPGLQIGVGQTNNSGSILQIPQGKKASGTRARTYGFSMNFSKPHTGITEAASQLPGNFQALTWMEKKTFASEQSWNCDLGLFLHPQVVGIYFNMETQTPGYSSVISYFQIILPLYRRDSPSGVGR